MNKHVKSYQQLLTYNVEDNSLTGAMSPVLASKEFCQLMGVPKAGTGTYFNGIVRIWFEDDEIHNKYEGQGKTGLTGCDTLVICQWYKDNDGNYFSDYYSFIDMGSRHMAVAMKSADKDEITMTPIYKENKHGYEKILTEADWKEIFADITTKQIFLCFGYEKEVTP